MKALIMSMCCLWLAGCVSTHMAKYVGSDIREVIIDSGNPVNVFDLADGKRAFQFYWGGGTMEVPRETTTTGHVSVIGSTAWTSQTSVTTGGYVVERKGCLTTYIAGWDATKNGWIILETRYPKRLVC